MTPGQFNAAATLIENQLADGEGYFLNISMKSGVQWLDYAWRRIETVEPTLIELSKPDRPPVWISVSDIESVELCS